MHTRRSLAALFVLSLALCAIVAGTTTASAQITINVPVDQPTIQAGINAAHTGDTVLVAPGTYTIPITATGATTHISHAANLTLTITP